MERKTQGFWIMGTNLLKVKDEFELAREYGYRLITSHATMENYAADLKTDLGRILICEDLPKAKQ